MIHLSKKMLITLGIIVLVASLASIGIYWYNRSIVSLETGLASGPQITSFTADPVVPVCGGTTTLSWVSDFTDSNQRDYCQLYRNAGNSGAFDTVDGVGNKDIIVFSTGQVARLSCTRQATSEKVDKLLTLTCDGGGATQTPTPTFTPTPTGTE